MSKYDSPRRGAFLKGLPTISIEGGGLAERAKFNFSYFCDVQEPAYGFDDLSKDDLEKLLNKHKDYSRFPLQHWRNQRQGAGGRSVLEIYGKFPKKSEFKHPAHVPHDAIWARFRLDQVTRLVGFLVPPALDRKQEKTHTLCANTFYIVFLDLEHKFYLTEQP